MKNLFLFATLFYVFLALPVNGVQILDSKSRFSAKLDFPGSSLCILYPPDLRTEKNCEGLKIPSFGDDPNTLPLCVGAVRGKDFNVMFKADDWAVPHAGPVNEKIGRGFLEGFLKGAQKEVNGSEASRLEEGLVMVKGEPVYRYHGDIKLPNSQHARILLYLFSGQDYRYSMYLLALADKDLQLQTVGERFVQSVKVPPPTGSYEAENADSGSESWGKIINGFSHLLISGFFIWLLWKLGKAWLEYRRH